MRDQTLTYQLRIARFMSTGPPTSSLSLFLSLFRVSTPGTGEGLSPSSGRRALERKLSKTPPPLARVDSGPAPACFPDPNSKLRIRVFPTGPQLQAPDGSAPCRTRTASYGSECPPPALSCKRQITVYPADQSVPTSTTKNLRRYAR